MPKMQSALHDLLAAMREHAPARIPATLNEFTESEWPGIVRAAASLLHTLRETEQSEEEP